MEFFSTCEHNYKRTYEFGSIYESGSTDKRTRVNIRVWEHIREHIKVWEHIKALKSAFFARDPTSHTQRLQRLVSKLVVRPLGATYPCSPEPYRCCRGVCAWLLACQTPGRRTGRDILHQNTFCFKLRDGFNKTKNGKLSTFCG